MTNRCKDSLSDVRPVWLIVLVPIFVLGLVIGRSWGWGEQEKEKDVIKMEYTQMKQEARTGRDTKENNKKEGNGMDIKKDDNNGKDLERKIPKYPFTSLFLNGKDIKDEEGKEYKSREIKKDGKEEYIGRDIKVDDKKEDNDSNIKEDDKEENNSGVEKEDNRRDIKEYSKDGRDIKHDDKEMDDCMHTYTAHTPNLSFIKEKTVTFTINKCKNNQRQNLRKLKTGKNRRQRKNGRKQKKIGKDKENKENNAIKEQRKMQRERRRKERQNMELFAEQQRFKEWKRKESMDILLQKPQAQDAIHDLWKNLFKEGSHWGKIYQDMHQPPQTHRNRGGRPELVRQPLST